MAFKPPKPLLSAFLIWTAVQAAFFLPAKPGVWLIHSREGNFLIFQFRREVVIAGAFADRKNKFARYELIPFLKSRGIAAVRTLILTGHGKENTGAWPELEKNFKIQKVKYMPGTAVQMRETFQNAGKSVKMAAIKEGDVEKIGLWKIFYTEKKSEPFIRAESPDGGLEYAVWSKGNNLNPARRDSRNLRAGSEGKRPWFSEGFDSAYQLTVPGSEGRVTRSNP